MQTQQSLRALIANIEHSHHCYTREQLEHISNMLANLSDVPEVVTHCFQLLHEDLIPHLMKEECILFPYIVALERSRGGRPDACFGSIANPVGMMQVEHDGVKQLLKKMRQATMNYQPATDHLVQLYAALKALEDDLVEHINKEDALLFPLALQMELSLTA